MRILLPLLFTVLAFAQSPAPEAAVKQIVADYAAARNNRAPAEIEKLFTGDADQLVSSGTWRRGKDALVEGMLSSSAGNPGDRTLTVETVRFLAADVAVADARYEIAASGDRAGRQMWSTFVVLRTADGWRIAAIRNMLPTR